MQYLLLIYSNESELANVSKEAYGAMMGAYMDYTNALQGADVLRGGDALHPTSSATTVRVRSGDPVITHGPFAETKEQLGGYFLIDCANLDEAIAWAAKCPGAQFGSVEVRPVMPMP